MAVELIHLRKLLKILFLDPNPQRAALKADIREDRAREAGETSAGGDFYVPFWADAKDHVFGIVDLHERVAHRIEANPGRRNLYPRLRDGFLLWWDQRRRWTNQPFQNGPPVKRRFAFPRIAATVKIDSILSVRDGLGVERFVYPYFAPDPVLSERAAQLGLWLLTTALPEVPSSAIRILDVIRGRTFSLDRTSLRGDEEEEFRDRYNRLIQQRDELRDDDD